MPETRKVLPVGSVLERVRTTRSICLILGLGLLVGGSSITAAAQARTGYLGPTQSQLRDAIARHTWATGRNKRVLARHRSKRRRPILGSHAGPASGMPFQRGDIFLFGVPGIQEYSRDGQLRQTLSGVSNTGAACFDPSGQHLIMPGAGLFYRSGQLLPSNWGSVANAGRCVADSFGHVYVSSRSYPGGPWIVTKYDLAGDVLQAGIFSQAALDPLAIDLAPDECTMYYTARNASPPDLGIQRFNVCTDIPESTFSPGWTFLDDVRVLPNWQVLAIFDRGAEFFDASGQRIREYMLANNSAQRTGSLDRDGASFWTSGSQVTQFDLRSPQVLTQWQSSYVGQYSSVIAVYSPPLFGDANVNSTVDHDAAGTAEAFPTRVDYSGELRQLHLWVDSSSIASAAVVGIYSDRDGHPGALLTQGRINNLRPGSWNYVDVPSMSVAAGQRYWIAVLAPNGGGTLGLREAAGQGRSVAILRHHLTALPTRWSGEKRPDAARVSAYGS